MKSLASEISHALYSIVREQQTQGNERKQNSLLYGLAKCGVSLEKRQMWLV